MRLRVLTVNVQHDAGDPRRTGLLNRELRRLAPDRYRGTTVATRWPHRTVEVLGERPPEGSDDHAWTLAVSVQVPDLGELLLIVPTTAWRLDAEASRERQADYHDAWAVAGHGAGHTWTVDNPVAAAEIDRLVGQPGHRRRIDYVFVGSAHAHPQARTRIMSARLVGDHPVDGVWLGDHAGVLADLNLT